MKPAAWFAVFSLAAACAATVPVLDALARRSFVSDSLWRLERKPGLKASATAFRPDNRELSYGWRILVPAFDGRAEDIALVQPVRLPREPLTLRFWGRTSAQSSLVLRVGSFERFVVLPPKWREFVYKIPPGHGATEVRFFVGGERAAMDLADIRLTR